MAKTNETDIARNHPPSWAAMFGEDPGPSMFAEPSHEPSRSSSAVTMAKRRANNDKVAARARAMAQLVDVAREAEEDDALDRAVSRIRAGKRVDDKTMQLALAAARARGVDVPSAELLAAPAVERWNDEGS